MIEAGTSFALLGVICAAVAIIGGNVSLPGGAKVEALKTRSSRVLLLGLALVVGVIGFCMLIGPGERGSPSQVEVFTSSRTAYDLEIRNTCLGAAADHSRIQVPRSDSSVAWVDAYRTRGMVLEQLLYKVRSLPLPKSAGYEVIRTWDDLEEVIEAEERYVWALQLDPNSQLHAWIEVEAARIAYDQSARRALIPAECLLSRTCDMYAPQRDPGSAEFGVPSDGRHKPGLR